MAGGPPAGGIILVTVGDPDRLTGGYLYNRQVLGALRAAGLPAGQLALARRPLPLAMLTLRTVLARGRPRLVIVDSIALEPVAPLVGWMRRSLGARLLAVMHMLPSELAAAWRRPLLRHAERRLLRAADGVVAVSPSLRDRLGAASAASAPIVVIPPGRDGTPRPAGSAAERHGGRFLCVANWSPSKGIHTLVEAMAQLPPTIQLELVGEAVDGAYARRVQDLIRRHQLGERVRVHGPLPGPALGERYAAADVFVLPSLSEGFGTVYAEAMSFDLPVIACRVGPLPWLLDGGRCGVLVPPHDSAALAEAMRALATDAGLRRRLGQAAARRALSLPTWRESGEQFCSVVRGLFESGRSGDGSTGQAGQTGARSFGP